MHVQDYRDVVAELCRVLRVGGTLVISLNSKLSPLIQMNSLQQPIKHVMKNLLRIPPSEETINFQAHSPAGVIKLLREYQINVTKVQSDTLFCGDYTLPKFKFRVFPTIGMPLYRAIDSLLAARFPFSYFGWEVWFQGTKFDSADGSELINS